jgi:ribosomal protein S18 acetylase RimI-like enzyme
MEIKTYDDRYKEQVVLLWKTVFGYKDARNDPELAVNKKLEAKDGLFFIAVDGHKVIGTVMAGYDGHRGWIYSLAVIPEYRKQKIGSGLLQHAEGELEKRGCMKINLQILKTNETVKQFYLRNGYDVEERISMGKEIKSNVRQS